MIQTESVTPELWILDESELPSCQSGSWDQGQWWVSQPVRKVNDNSKLQLRDKTKSYQIKTVLIMLKSYALGTRNTDVIKIHVFQTSIKVMMTWCFKFLLIISTFATFWSNSADDVLKYFSYFSPENRIWHFMQTEQDKTFHANCLIMRQFAWNIKSCFLGKQRKIFQYITYVVCWNFYPEC